MLNLKGTTYLPIEYKLSFYPPSMELNPIIIRSRVVLPQPDGPSNVKNSPGFISNDNPSITVSLPNRFTTFSILIATLIIYSPFNNISATSIDTNGVLKILYLSGKGRL